MVNFANPMLLLLLIAVPVLAILYWYARYRRRRQLARFGKPQLLASLMPDVSKYLPNLKIIVALLAVASMAVMLARPRTRGKVIDEESRGIEVMVAVDVSNSMLASSTDELRGASRLQRAKHILGSLISRLEKDHIGLIVFAGDAFTQLPLTPDHTSARLYLNEISTGMVDNQGTDIGAAIQLAVNSFSGDEDVDRALIVITDAEDQTGDAVSLAKAAHDNGIEVDVIGLGSVKGAQIPLDKSYQNFLKDDDGHVVTTYFNEELARSIAEAGGGIYVNGASGSAIPDLVKHVGELKRSRIGQISYSTNDERFPVFAWIALVLIIIDCMFSNRKIGFLRKYNFFTRDNRARMVIIMALCGLGANAQALMPPVQPADYSSNRQERKLIAKGNEAFAQKNYGDAELYYLKAQTANPDSRVAEYNLAVTRLYLLPETAESKQDAEGAEDASPALKANEQAVQSLLNLESEAGQIGEFSAYNLGNLAFETYQMAEQQQAQMQALQESLNHYKNALRKNPLNEKARQNMRVVQKLLEQMQQDGGGGGNDNQDNQDQNQDQQQNQDQNQQDQEQNQDENQEQQQNQDQQQQQQQQNLSPESREQILKAIENKDAAARAKGQPAQGTGGAKRNNGKKW